MSEHHASGPGHEDDPDPFFQDTGDQPSGHGQVHHLHGAPTAEHDPAFVDEPLTYAEEPSSKSSMTKWIWYGVYAVGAVAVVMFGMYMMDLGPFKKEFRPLGGPPTQMMQAPDTSGQGVGAPQRPGAPDVFSAPAQQGASPQGPAGQQPSGAAAAPIAQPAYVPQNPQAQQPVAPAQRPMVANPAAQQAPAANGTSAAEPSGVESQQGSAQGRVADTPDLTAVLAELQGLRQELRDLKQKQSTTGAATQMTESKAHTLPARRQPVHKVDRKHKASTTDGFALTAIYQGANGDEAVLVTPAGSKVTVREGTVIDGIKVLAVDAGEDGGVKTDRGWIR